MLCAIAIAPASAEVIQIDPGIHSVPAPKEYPAPVVDVGDQVAVVSEVAIGHLAQAETGRSSVEVVTASFVHVRSAFLPA